MILGGRKPDYLVVQHMEPDHSANIASFLNAYPEAAVVANAKTFAMIDQFFGTGLCENKDRGEGRRVPFRWASIP